MQKGLCTPTKEAECLEEHGAELLEWTCAHCPTKKPGDISPYTHKLLRLRNLRIAGYPFKPNDLSLEEWEDLGNLEQWLETSRKSKSKSK